VEKIVKEKVVKEKVIVKKPISIDSDEEMDDFKPTGKKMAKTAV
jgi:hypothetical protein